MAFLPTELNYLIVNIDNYACTVSILLQCSVFKDNMKNQRYTDPPAFSGKRDAVTKRVGYS